MDLQIDELLSQYATGVVRPQEVVRALHARAAASASRNLWTELQDLATLLEQAAELERRKQRGDALPLYGIPFVAKDNIDVVGFATTAACPSFAHRPERSAFVVERLLGAGAICLGKTNMDQFATGLVGTRSPFGACVSAFDERYVSGGSSSGSALAVALGLVSFSLGTDTAGSGRVPAGFNNIVGLKPSRGLSSCSGVVPACRTLDCISIFAGNALDAFRVLTTAEASDPADPYSRSRSPGRFWAATGDFRFGVPGAAQLEFFGDEEARAAFAASVEQLQALGGEQLEFDLQPFLDVAALLYTGPWVAERYAAVGEFVEAGAEDVDPHVRAIISEGKRWSGVDTFRAQYRLAELTQSIGPLWNELDLLVLPTTPTAYTLDQVRADPLRLNANLGRYTNFANLLDLCGVAVPAGIKPSGMPCGVTLLAPACEEEALSILASRFHDVQDACVGATETPVRKLGEAQGKANVSPATLSPSRSSAAAGARVELLVVGAHLRGQPLNAELRALGAEFVRETRTAPKYRFFALDATPPKPGLVRDEAARGTVYGEVFALSMEAFGRFVDGVPAPLCIGSVQLTDGSWVKGFLCEHEATRTAEDITHTGSWLRFLDAGS